MQLEYRIMSIKHQLGVSCIGWPIVDLEIPFIPYDWLSRFQVIRRAVNMLHIKHLVVHPWDGEAEKGQIAHLIVWGYR